jgi:hypothetical protein
MAPSQLKISAAANFSAPRTRRNMPARIMPASNVLNSTLRIPRAPALILAQLRLLLRLLPPPLLPFLPLLLELICLRD